MNRKSLSAVQHQLGQSVEMVDIALPILFNRLPGLRMAEQPAYGDVYHFHGLTKLMLNR